MPVMNIPSRWYQHEMGFPMKHWLAQFSPAFKLKWVRQEREILLECFLSVVTTLHSLLHAKAMLLRRALGAVSSDILWTSLIGYQMRLWKLLLTSNSRSPSWQNNSSMLREFFSEFCWGKAAVAYTKPQQRKKEESEWLRERETRSRLLILDLKGGKLQDSGMQ